MTREMGSLCSYFPWKTINKLVLEHLMMSVVIECQQFTSIKNRPWDFKYPHVSMETKISFIWLVKILIFSKRNRYLHWRKTLKVGFGAHNDVCGDRMPLININKDKTLAFHIIACASGSNKAYTTSKDSKFPDQVKID